MTVRMSGPSSTTAVRNTQGMKKMRMSTDIFEIRKFIIEIRDMSEVQHLNMHEARVALF